MQIFKEKGEKFPRKYQKSRNNADSRWAKTMSMGSYTADEEKK